MYNGKNLIDIRAPNVKKYGLKLASLLFTETELAEGVINPCDRKTDRKPLDKKRVDLIQEAIMLKYELDLAEFHELLWSDIYSSINAKGRGIKRRLALLFNQ